jgi:hypothetical protein
MTCKAHWSIRLIWCFWLTWPARPSAYKKGKVGTVAVLKIVQPPRPLSCSIFALVWLIIFPIFLHHVCIGKALPANTLHHKNHVVMLLIPSTTPPHLARPRRRRSCCAACVQHSEAPHVAALRSDHEKYTDHVHLKIFAVRSIRVCRSDFPSRCSHLVDQILVIFVL